MKRSKSDYGDAVQKLCS